MGVWHRGERFGLGTERSRVQILAQPGGKGYSRLELPFFLGEIGFPLPFPPLIDLIVGDLW